MDAAAALLVGEIAEPALDLVDPAGSKALTQHGKRHGLKVWMDEDQIADVLKSERLGHDEPGMRGVYGHVSPAMREELEFALQSRWEQLLHQCAALSPVSAVYS